MIEFKCPHCGRILRISEDHVGAEGACRHCGGRILVQVNQPQPALDDWTGMLAEAETPAPEQAAATEAAAHSKGNRLETDVSLLQALLAQSRGEVERLARDLEAAKNARIEAEVARDIAEARAKRMEERLVAEAGRNDLTVLATDLERAINQLAQSRAEVDRMAKEIEMERTAKIRAEISGRLLETNLRRLQSDIAPEGGFVADEVPNETQTETIMVSEDPEPAQGAIPLDPAPPKPPEAAAAETPAVPAALRVPVSPNPTLRLDKIMTPRRKRSSLRTVTVAIVIALAATFLALWLPSADQFRARSWQYALTTMERLGLTGMLTKASDDAGPSKADLPTPADGATEAQDAAKAPVPSAPPTSSDPAADSVRGTVVDAETHAPLIGVPLRITGEAAKEAPVVVSSIENGAFAAPQLGYGQFTIQCVDPPPGYSVSIPTSGVREKDKPLSPFEIPLSKPATAPPAPAEGSEEKPVKPVEVLGKVVTASGDPAPEVQIALEAQGADPKPVAISDATGTFSFSAASGSVTLVAVRGTAKSEALALQVPQAGLASPVELKLPPVGRIVFRVKKQGSAAPLAVQSCTLSYQGHVFDDPKLMVASAEGLTIPCLTPGSYDVAFAVTGYKSVPLKGLIIDDRGTDCVKEIALTPLGR